MKHKRTIYLFGEIDNKKSEEVISKMHELEQSNQDKPITIIINSNGGDVPSGLAIYDTMQMMRCPIETVCVGMAYSMAAYLLASGTTGMRRIGDNARVLLHPTHVTYSGRLCDASGDIQNSKELTASLTEILVKHTKMELQRVCSVQEEDCYMSACDAEEIGLVDEIIEQKEEVNNG